MAAEMPPTKKRNGETEMERWFVEFFWMTETNGLKFEKKVFKTWEEAQGFKHLLNCDERVQDIKIIKVDGFKYIK